MKQWFMLTVVGEDQPGVVTGLSGALYQVGVNLGEASMARLGGHFSIMLMAETEADEVTLQRELESFAHKAQLHVHIDRVEDPLHQRVEPNVRIAVLGANHPGIVAQVAAALTSAGLSVLDLDSDIGGTTDKPIYIMVIDSYAQGGVPTVEQALEPIRLSGIEVRLTPLDMLIG